MKRACAAMAVVTVLTAAAGRPLAQQSSGAVASPAVSSASALDLVGTWTLATTEVGVDREKPVTVPNPRGLLIFDAGGHVFEVISRASRQVPGLSNAQATFVSYAGFWGRYTADIREKTIALRPLGGFSPNVMGTGLTRTFEVSGDRLTVTSFPGEPHTQGITRWTWERVPNVDHLSDTYRKVIGFWEHVSERRVNLTTGASTTEATRAPSVIVYTPTGYVGVHFPPLNRATFAAAEPTEAEAQAAMRGYIGYYGALGVYPGMVFHQILIGISPASGTTLKRHFELSGADLNVRFLPSVSIPGQQTMTYVTLRRLSGEAEMLPPPRR